MFPKGFGNLGNIGGMFKQALELKGKMEQLKERLAEERIDASAGGGMVTVVMNGKMELLSLKVDPEVVRQDDHEMLETLLKAAVNEGVRKAHDLVRARMTELTGGIDIPGVTS